MVGLSVLLLYLGEVLLTKRAAEKKELYHNRVSLVAQIVKKKKKKLPAMQETQVRSLGWKDPLQEGMATHSNILAWRIPMDRGAWQATVQGVAKSRTGLSN